MRGCLGRVGCAFGGCWAVWQRDVFRTFEGLLLWVKCAEWVGKGLIHHENALSGAESAAFCLGRSRVGGSMLVCGCRRVFYQP